MICLMKHTNMVSSAIIWLFDKESEKPPKADIVEFVQSNDETQIGKEFLSLITDLNLEEDNLLKAIDKQTRYEIRRIEREMPDYFEAGIDSVISYDKIQDFFTSYDMFAKTKGLRPINRRDIMDMYEQNLLSLSIASLEGKTLVYHTYVCDSNKARLLNSVSMFRGDEGISKSKIGMLNRWLHWQDILNFKKKGLSMMDWGGISYSNPDIANITKFKKEFGGSEYSYKSYVKTLTLKGIIYRFLLKVLNRIEE